MRHKKTFLTTLLLCAAIPWLQAQDASLATGGTGSGSGGTATYSIGQPMYQTQSGTGFVETQGVQQPYEISVVTALNDLEGISLFFSAYPNPTSNELNLKIEKYSTKDLTYQLTDMNGKVLQSSKVSDERTQLSLSTYATATYFLSVSKNNQLIKSFKIIKN